MKSAFQVRPERLELRHVSRRPDPWATWSAAQRAEFLEVAGPDLLRYGLATPEDLVLPAAGKTSSM